MRLVRGSSSAIVENCADCEEPTRHDKLYAEVVLSNILAYYCADCATVRALLAGEQGETVEIVHGG